MKLADYFYIWPYIIIMISLDDCELMNLKLHLNDVVGRFEYRSMYRICACGVSAAHVLQVSGLLFAYLLRRG